MKSLLGRLLGTNGFDPATIAVLNRLLDYLEADQQNDINAAAASVTALAQRLQTSNANLQQSTDKGK